MIDKVQKIREEVQRLMNELIQEKERGYGSDIDDACILELQNVLTFIDSLKEEPTSEDLKKFAEEWDESLYRSDAVIAGANWQKEKMMAKAIDGHIYRQYMEDGVSIDYGVEANLDVHKHNFADGDIVRVVVIKEV